MEWYYPERHAPGAPDLPVLPAGTLVCPDWADAFRKAISDNGRVYREGPARIYMVGVAASFWRKSEPQAGWHELPRDMNVESVSSIDFEALLLQETNERLRGRSGRLQEILKEPEEANAIWDDLAPPGISRELEVAQEHRTRLNREPTLKELREALEKSGLK